MKKLFENLMENLRHAEFTSFSQNLLILWKMGPFGVISASQTDPHPSCGHPLPEVEGKKWAFTLAEVLITLGIIGVVAALTIPTLVSNYRKHVVETSLKRSVSVLEQAIKLAEVDYGEIASWDAVSAPETIRKYLMPYIPGSKFISESELGHYYICNGKDCFTANANWASALQLKTGEILRVGRGFNWPQYPEGLSGRIDLFTKPNKDNTYSVGKDFFEFYVSKKGQVGSSFHLGRCNDNEKLSWAKTHCSKSYGQEPMCTFLLECNGWVVPDDYPVKF